MNNNNEEPKKNNGEKKSVNIVTPTTLFKLPITFVEVNKLHKLDEHILTDLELIECSSSNNNNSSDSPTNSPNAEVVEALKEPETKTKTMYEHVFNPKTIYGKQFLSNWATYYTSDVTFLKQTQKLIKHFSPPPPPNNESESEDPTSNNIEQYSDIHAIWNSIQNDKNFKDKFGYIDIGLLEPLNSSSFFLQILSLQNLASPVISLLTPLIILIIPFFLLKIQQMPVSFSSYVSSLKRIAQYHPIGKVFENFSSIPWDKRIYMFVSIAFYFLQIYQNVVSCHRFYKNMFLIHNNIHKFSSYIEHSIRNITYIHSITENLSSYKQFREESAVHAQVLSALHSDIKTVMPFKLTLANISNIGTIMKYYYQIFANESVKNAISYSFGFNSYFEHLSGLKSLVLTKKIAPCTFVKSAATKTYLESSYYAPLMNQNPVKNKILLHKKTTITGPNAAGKTTLIKSTLLNVILSQQLGYGFYKKAKLLPYHYVHSYLNIPDTSGRDSLFQAESRRCREILTCLLENKTKRHFCIFDELYSGTNPYEAVASAFGFIKYLNKYENLDLLLTTHYTKLCELLQAENVQNMHMKIELCESGQIKYLYKLDKGISSIKGGIKVLEDLDYPAEIINSTRVIINSE
uniref:DNA mismatch repair proteins mutS family domain-containing protein n=1 Tax=viral metagenome TaxID=1070528 RepID=A0A6C0I2J0_9ZZZZ